MKLLPKLCLVASLALAASGALHAQTTSDDLNRLLTEARAQLASLQERYTTQHPAVRAQQAKIATLEREISGESAADTASARSPITVNFRGGSLAQLAEAIAVAGGTFNIIGTAEDLNAALLPAISVRNADPAALMESLNALLQPRNMYLERPRKGPAWIEGTYTVYRRSPSAREGRSSFESFQLGSFLADQSVDDIVGAIRAAWELDPAHDADALKLKFHPPTTILLASGPSDAIVIVREVLTDLKRPSAERPAARSVPPSPGPEKK